MLRVLTRSGGAGLSLPSLSHRHPISRCLSTLPLGSNLPRVEEPPLPTASDAEHNRPFSSRRMLGSGGALRDRDIVSMWIADMDFRAPQPIVDAVMTCAERGIFGYTVCPPALTDATVERLGRVYGCTAPQAEWLGWLPGLVPCLSNVCRVASTHSGADGTDPCGVAVLTPAYPPFLKLPAHNGLVLETVPLRQDTQGAELRFEIDWSLLERTLAKPSTKLFLLCNPHNPTGRCWTRAELRRFASLCCDFGVMLCSDEVWGELPLDPTRTPFTSTLALLDDYPALSERLIVTSSPSKCAATPTRRYPPPLPFPARRCPPRYPTLRRYPSLPAVTLRRYHSLPAATLRGILPESSPALMPPPLRRASASMGVHAP